MTDKERYDAEMRAIMKLIGSEDKVIVKKEPKKEPKKAKKEEK